MLESDEAWSARGLIGETHSLVTRGPEVFPAAFLSFKKKKNLPGKKTLKLNQVNQVEKKKSK